MIEEFLSSPWVIRLGWTLLHSLWEGIAIAVFFLPLMTILRHRSPQARYGVSIAAMLAMIVGVAITFCMMAAPRPVSSAGTGGFSPSVQISDSHSPTPDEQMRHPISSMAVRDSVPSKIALQSLLPLLAAAWVVGVLILGLWNLGGWIVVQRIKGWDLQPAGSKLSAAASVAAERLGVGRAFGLFQSIHVTSPLVIGWLKPVLLVPTAVATGLTPQQLEAILAHELAHIRRHDYLVNLLQVAMETIFFYHPAIWLISRRIRVERELCCDDIAAAACLTRVDYAASLAAMEEALSPIVKPVFAMAARGSGPSELLIRIRRLLNITTTMPRQGSRWFAANLSLILLAVIASICLHHAKADTPTPATEPGASRVPVSVPVREFNSKLKLQVFLSPVREMGSGPYLGRTPAKKPLNIPLDNLWYVRPDSTVDRQLLMQEVGTQQIPGLSLADNASDNDLANLKDLGDLRVLIAVGQDVTDVGVEDLQGLTKLQYVDLSRTKVTDGGLSNLKGMTALQTLILESTQVSNEGLGHLKGLTSMQTLNLCATRVTDEGLANLEGMTDLQWLDLIGTRVTDEGLAHLKGLTKLQEIYLTGTQVTGEGLDDLKSMPNLKTLSLMECRKVTDAGLAHLDGLTSLESLNLIETPVTDVGLKCLDNLKGLRMLGLKSTAVTGAGLEHLDGLTALQFLRLDDTHVTDEGLAHIKGLVKLQSLDLSRTSVTDDGLKNLEGLTALQMLVLERMHLTDAGLAHLEGLTALHSLYIDNTQVTDQGLSHLKGLKNLQVLNVGGTQVTDAGIAALKQALPHCQIEH